MITKSKVAVVFFIIVVLLSGCRNKAIVPKPRGYFRIALPEKSYVIYTDTRENVRNLPFTFEYPSYGKISYESQDLTAPGWLNIDFPLFKARLYLTYMNVNKNLGSLMDQAYTLNVKNHIIKADAINESIITNPEKKVFGTLYDLKGNTATSVQFFVTDSVRHYLRGSLYFSVEPDPDSLAPVTEFLRKDIDHLIETFEWK